MSDQFLDELLEALLGDPDPGWDSWYAEHGRGPSVMFSGGGGIPLMIDCLRFAEFKRGGIDAQRAFESSLQEEAEARLQRGGLL